jgi:hypothetical protein
MDAAEPRLCRPRFLFRLGGSVPATALLAGLLAVGPAATAQAQSQVVIHQGALQQYCYAKYQARGLQATAEPVRYSVYGAQLLCRLPGTTFGYTLENHSVADVCAYLTGSSSSQNQNGQIVCLGSAAKPKVTNPNDRVFGPSGGWTTRCAWANGGYRC